MSQNSRVKGQSSRAAPRTRSGNRALIACVNCKEKKLKCDNKASGCENCRRWGSICLVEDPATKKHRPRNYLETLEQRVAFLEDILKEYRPDLANDHLSQGHSPRPESQLTSSITTQSADDQYGNLLTEPRSHGQDDKQNGFDELASKVGLLSLNAAGAEPHYLGSSSTFAFSRLLNSSLRQVIITQPDNANTFCQTEDDSPCPLPEYEVAIKLSDAYFRHIHPQYPFIHEPTFRTWEGMLMRGSTESEITFSSVPLFFLNMVYAVGALLLPNSGYSAKRLYISAHMYIDHILLRENLETIQAILCCAVYSLRSSIGTSHWKLAGLALRQCVDLGYHRNSKRFRTAADPLRLELRKRVLWCAYAMESQAAIMLGRPQGIPYQEVDAEYPTDIDDTCITDTGIQGMPRSSPNDPPTSITKAIHTFRIRRLLSRIHSSLYSNATPCCSGKHNRDTEVQHLRAEIESWRAEIPTTPCPTEAFSLFSTSDWFDLEYNYTILQLYRVQIIDQATATDSVFFECLRAAESICHSYRRQFLGKPMSYTWTALHELFLAGLTYLHCLWTSPTARQAYRQGQVSSTCTDCTIVLVIIAERWEAAAPYRDIFGTLANRTMMMMDDKADGSWALPIGSREPDDGGEGDLMNWMTRVTDTGMSEGINTLFNSFVGDFSTHEQDL
ncbi:putative transcriptional activator protein acu-15 [Aspergillus cavernicola]|uniref:Transcriptional activator protein acu-15 n=1 Tax=Aspergillus cavernicola TaxID=176166 RepID=A0ABR4ICH0_9EURO